MFDVEPNIIGIGGVANPLLGVVLMGTKGLKASALRPLEALPKSLRGI